MILVDANVLIYAVNEDSPQHDKARAWLAFNSVDTWLAHPNVVVSSPDAGHAIALRDLLGRTGSAANLVNDAHLAALALAHGATVASYDGDFNRFGVVWTTPNA